MKSTSFPQSIYQLWNTHPTPVSHDLTAGAAFAHPDNNKIFAPLSFPSNGTNITLSLLQPRTRKIYLKQYIAQTSWCLVAVLSRYPWGGERPTLLDPNWGFIVFLWLPDLNFSELWSLPNLIPDQTLTYFSMCFMSTLPFNASPTLDHRE